MINLSEIQSIQKGNVFPNKNYLASEGEGLVYWRYRVLRPLIKLMYKTFRFLNRPAPWLSPAATIFLKRNLNNKVKVAEFGSGFSTLFIAPKVELLVSVEHNKEWFDMISTKLKEGQVKNVDYKLHEQEIEFEGKEDPKFVEEYKLEKEDYQYRKDYVSYFSALKGYEDEFFDYIIVDGRARPECVFSSYSKLKKGGLMILDNSERERYNIVFDKLFNLKMVNTTNGLTNTTFWEKV